MGQNTDQIGPMVRGFGRMFVVGVIVLRDLVDLKVTSALGSARDHVRRHVERMKELTLRSLEGPRKTVDPVEAMRMMADALPHDHLTVPG